MVDAPGHQAAPGWVQKLPALIKRHLFHLNGSEEVSRSVDEDQICESYFGDPNDHIYISYKSLCYKVLLCHVLSFLWGKYFRMNH